MVGCVRCNFVERGGLTHATLRNRAGCLGLAVACLGTTGLGLGGALGGTCLLLDRIFQRLHALLYVVSVQLPAMLGGVLPQQLCLRLCRLSVLRASLVLRIAKGTGNSCGCAKSDASSTEPGARPEIATVSG